MTEHPIAFVDESFIQAPGHPGVYLFAAVLLDRAELSAAANAAHAVAATVGAETNFHTTTMWHRGHVGAIENMLDVVEEYAGWTLVVADTPVAGTHPGRSTIEHLETSRQASLERLLTDLNRQKVRDVLLDTRASREEWRQVRSEGRKVPKTDRVDLRTYGRLVRSKEISHRMRLIHVSDEARPALWLADAVAWAARRALSMDEPQWWLRVAHVATVVDASTGTHLDINDNRAAPPLGERDPHSPSQSARATLLPALEPPPEYGRRGPLPTGAILTSVMRQVDAARTAQRPSDTDVHRRLLAQMRALNAQVQQLRHDIDAMAGGSSTRHSRTAPPEAVPERSHGGRPSADESRRVRVDRQEPEID